MDSEIQLISDGDGLAVIGDARAVDRFLASEEMASTDLGLQRLGSVLGTGAAVAQAGSVIAAESGRWVKLTAESAAKIKKYGLTPTKTPGVSHAMLGQRGSIKSWLQIESRSSLASPGMLAGAAGIMAQLAMQQTMDEITDYLAAINEKVDDVLRAQKDAVLARMIGVGFVIQEAMTLRASRGRVDEVTWSKVQTAPATIAETQAYALRQLDALAEKLEHKTKIGELAEAAKEAEGKVREWLAVLARCFQLQDGIAVLELDRVLDASPAELDGHRLGLKAARNERLDVIVRCTEQLMARMDAAAGTANAKVLLHPTTSPVVVQARQHVSLAVDDLHGRLGIESSRSSLEARRWVDAASEFKDKTLETGADRVDVAKRLSNQTLDRAKSVTGKLPGRITERTRRRRGDEEKGDGQA